MVSSIWKPEIVMYLSNTAKQSVLTQWTANIPANAPQFRTMPPVCHYPQFRCYYHSLSFSLFWAPISHQMPPVQPFPAPGRNSPMHYSQWPKQISKRDLWMGKDQGGKGIMSQLSAHKIGMSIWAELFQAGFQAEAFRPSHYLPLLKWETLRVPKIVMNFSSSVPHFSSPALNKTCYEFKRSKHQHLFCIHASCWKALLVSL